MLIAATAAFGQKRQLDDTSWKIVEAYGQRVKRSMASIAFDSSVTRFSGNTGCNSMSGSVEVRGKNIDFGAIRTTKRACKLMAGAVAEETLLRGLRDARRFEVRNDSLRLEDRRGRALLRFARANTADNSSEDTRLDEKRWVLEQIKGRQTFVPLPRAFISFDSRKSSAGGDTSCNSFGSDYSVNGSSVRITNIISTMRACVEDSSRMSTEREMLAGLREADRYEISGNRLMLYRGRQTLLTFRGESK